MLNSYCSTSTSSNSADLLCQLVHGAQEKNREAINELCKKFEPLIYKLTSSSYIRDSLGEDAVNDAWVYFLEFIQAYDGDDFKHLPGLIKTSLKFRLMHQRDASVIKQLELTLSGNDNPEAQIANPKNEILDFETIQTIKDLFSSLSKAQCQVLTMHILEKESLVDISEKLGKSYHSVYALYCKGIKKLRKIYGVNLRKEGVLRSVLLLCNKCANINTFISPFAETSATSNTVTHGCIPMCGH